MSEPGPVKVDVGTKTEGAAPRDAAKGGSGLLRIVGVFILVTGALLVWVAVGTVQASRDLSVRSGLDYEGFLGAVDDLLEGAGDSALIRFDEVEARLSRGRTVTFDTIVILADVEEFPAFDHAGFLFDQVQGYNRFQRERLDLARVYPEWWDRLTGFNPSIFRLANRPDGTQALGRAPAAWSLRVRSPLEGGWDGEVQARDVVRGDGLASPRVTVPLGESTTLVHSVKGRRRLCDFVAEEPEAPGATEVRVYCLSEQRIPQATLRLGGEGGSPGWALAGWSDLWVDGRRIESGDSVRMPPGSVLRLDPLEPLVFGEHWEGVLSSEQWINGRMRRRNGLSPPMDLFSGLGSGSVGSDGRVSPDAFVELSVSSRASQDLTTRLADFLDSEVDLPLDFGVMVLGRIRDGEIVAVAEVGERQNRGRSSLLERVAPGSAVKPLLAAAILSQRPELAGMEIQARSGTISSVVGMPRVPARRAFTTALNCASPEDGRIDLRYFLRCSNNEYAASLLVAGLAEEGVPGSTWRGSSALPLDGRMVPRTVLLRSPLSEGLNELFDLPTDPEISDVRRRSRRFWDGLRFSDGTPFPVPFEILPSESRPALLAPGSPDGTDLSLLYRYAIGAWENQWSVLDLTNSFARIVSDRRIQLTFSKQPESPGEATPGSIIEGGTGLVPDSTQADPGVAGPEFLGLAEHRWYSSFLGGLAGVAADGTASGLRAAWREEGLPRTVYAKTGTLNEPGEPTPTDDLFSKSLLFAVGNPPEGDDPALGCGLVGGLYLRFAEGPRSGNLPSYQVEFAIRRLGDFLKDYWEEFGACPEAGS